MCMHYDAGNWNYCWGVSDSDMYDDVEFEDEQEPEDEYDRKLREEEREMSA